MSDTGAAPEGEGSEQPRCRDGGDLAVVSDAPKKLAVKDARARRRGGGDLAVRESGGGPGKRTPRGRQEVARQSET